MEVLTSFCQVVFEKIVDNTIGAAARHMGYLIHYQKYVDNLRTEVTELNEVRDSVQQKVEAVDRNVEEIEAEVQRWLTSVEEITAKVQKFFEDEGQANLKTRYQLGRRAHKLGLAVKDIKDMGTFHRVYNQGGYEDFASRKIIFDGVMKTLKDDNIRAIGVLGMAGSGKTVLVRKVATQAIADNLFGRIVKVVVSQAPDLKEIQKYIAMQLGLSFQDEETDSQKANLLRERLKEAKILLIIDDIWNKIDLKDLGVSFGDDHKGSKLLLTSRSRDVLATDMDAQKIFDVGFLSNDEAEYLFSKRVGDLPKNLNVQSIMVEVVKECAGLPIAITTVANALKNIYNPSVWKNALQQLKRANPKHIKGMQDQVYRSIKLSYDFLTKEKQSLFLFCSSFEEDRVISIELLLRILVGLDFFQDVYTMEEVRNKVQALVESLKDSCLLLEGNGSGSFKMHKLIRNVAIYIADEDKKMLTIRSSNDLEKCSNMKNLKEPIGMALFDVKFSDLPKRLEFPQLNFILLGKKGNSSAIPDQFFEGVKELKVLVLFEARISLPSSLSTLHNLQSLVLRDCELEDVAIIGELKNLKALTLSGSNIKQLPIELGQLTRLQLLDLKRCTRLEVIPPNVLSNLKRLEELYMKSSFNKWQVDGESTERNNTRVSELDYLSRLTTLCIHIPNAKILPKALLFEKLERYEILIGNQWDWDEESDSDDEFKSSKMVKLEFDRRFQANVGIIILLKRCEYLDLAPKEGLKNILYEVDKKGFPQLKHLYVRNSTEIQYIINLVGSQRVVFPLLEFLSLDNMTNLEKICHGHDQLAMGSFRSLRKLEVSNCDELKFVFSLTMLGCFSQLQEIVIENCKVMSAIVAKERKHEIQVNDITDDVKTNIADFSQLRSLDLQNLPNLMGFYSDVDSQLLFSEKVAFFNLETIFINGINNLKMLWHNQLVSDSICKIKKLHVGSCKNLMNVFPPNMLSRLQNLEELKVEDCNSVEEVFEVRGENVDEICDKGSTQLRHLTLINLPKLKHVWTSDPEAILTFQNLRRVEVSKCKTLKSLFPVSVAKSLEHLESLCINDCGLLEEIVALEEGSERMTKFVFLQITSLTLQSLPELKCFYPGKHTSKWPSLKSLTISKCDKVKIVASNELSFTETDELGDHVLVQQPLFLIEEVAFFNLETIFINGINNLKMLWHNQLVPDSICKIKKLHVGSCKNLMNVFPPNMLRRLQNLEELKIEDCNSVEEVFEVRGENVDEICDKGSTQLRNLTLINLPKLKHVWTSDLEAILTFPNLRHVKVSRCKTLKSLFPVSVAKSLEQLESLHISHCELVEEIVTLEEGSERMTKFVFPQITSLTLQSLPELKCFYPGKHTSEWPSLKSLTISKCDKVKIVASNELSFTETDELGDHVLVQQPLFLIQEVAFFNLETIFINGINNLKMLWHNQLVPDSICKIKKLHVGSCKNLMNVFPPNMLRSLQNLEELKIEDCNSVEEVFEVRGENVDEICDKGSTQLRHLTLINLPKLKHVWTSDPEAILTFQNLRRVEVSKCKTLKSLFPVSVAKSLEHLESLCINDCGLLEEIVALEEGSERMTKFVFPQITSLTLQSLPELKCFYPGKHTSKWPSLKSLTISKCDKVKIVASNELSFTETDELGDHVLVQQPLFLIEEVAFFNLETIFINGINNLKMLWHNQLVPDSICKIKKLHVGSCKNLMNVFPPNMLRRLPFLTWRQYSSML
ncbi:hypothetical protein ACB092_07G004500 [Castanea dentata]